MNKKHITREDIYKVRTEPNSFIESRTRTYAMQALQDGFIETVQKLIKNDKIDYSIKDNNDQDFMHYAIKSKNKPLIASIIEQNIDINVRDKTGKTALFLLFEEKEPDLIFAKWLIDNGADPNIRDKRGNLPLHIAAQEHDITTVSFLLKYTTNVDKPNHTGIRPIHYAAQKNNLSVLQEIMHYRVNILATSNQGENILHHALENNDDEIINYLLKTDAVKMLNVEDIRNKQTPFHKAILQSKIDVAYSMTKLGANINQEDGKGSPPVLLGLKGKSVDLLRMLLSQGADISNTTILYDCIYDHDNVEKYFNILMEYTSDVDVIGFEGETPLMRALQSGKNHIIEKLLSAGADVKKISDDGKSVLFFLGKTCRGDNIRDLIAKGVDVDHKDNIGNTAIQELVNKTHANEHIKILVENGADINKLNTKGLNVLHRVLMYNPDIVLAEWLIDNDGDVNELTKDNVSVLQLASTAKGASKNLLPKILSKGLDINSVDDIGNTALHRAVLSSQAENVKFLLEHGADPNIENKFHDSAASAIKGSRDGATIRVFNQFCKNKKQGLFSKKFGKFNKKSHNDNKPNQGNNNKPKPKKGFFP